MSHGAETRGDKLLDYYSTQDKLRDAVALELPRVARDKTFLGGMSQRRFEARARTGDWGRLGYLRVSNQFFIDHTLRDGIPQEIRNKLGGSIIWLWNFQISAANNFSLNYSAIPVFMMGPQFTDLRGRHVLDLGGGDGLLGLTAVKNGAKKVTSVDLDERVKENYRHHIDENGMDQSAFDLVTADIGKPDEVLAQVQDPETIELVVANIGPSYGDIHFKAIEVFNRLPKAQVFIGGGYIKGPTFMDPSAAIEMLAESGSSWSLSEMSTGECLAFSVGKNKFHPENDPFERVNFGSLEDSPNPVVDPRGYLALLVDKASDEIPLLVLHGMGRYKVRRNWWNGFFGALKFAEKGGLIMGDLQVEVDGFFKHYYDFFNGEVLVGSEDIRRANDLANKILGRK